MWSGDRDETLPRTTWAGRHESGASLVRLGGALTPSCQDRTTRGALEQDRDPAPGSLQLRHSLSFVARRWLRQAASGTGQAVEPTQRSVVTGHGNVSFKSRVAPAYHVPSQQRASVSFRSPSWRPNRRG